MTALDVVRALDEAVRRHGKPRHLRSDNGGEFISGVLRRWLEQRGIVARFIEPGSPVPTQAAVDGYLSASGFARSGLFPFGFYFYNQLNGLAVADAQPNNILVAPVGRLAPIYLVIGRPGSALLRSLLAEPAC
jgi:hypothetical protein